MKLRYCMFVAFMALSTMLFADEETNESLKYIIEQNNKLIQKVNSLEARQKVLEQKITKIEKQGPSAVNKKASNRQAPDPNKRYNVKIGDSIVLGNKDAKVTIIEWTDFQ